MADVKISYEDWLLLAHVLFSDDPERQRTAFNLLKREYADKARRLELKRLYKTNPEEYERVHNMTDAEYMCRLRQKYNRVD